MHSKGAWRGLVVSFCFALGTGCGLFGSKDGKDLVLQPQANGIGCLNDLGDKFSRYFKGAIEENEWQKSFDCVVDQVAFFKRYIRGNHPQGYSKADIAALTRNFLITNRPVTDQFVASIFDIKASLIGGSPDVITPSELDEFMELTKVLKRESLQVLPAIVEKVRNPKNETLLKLADAISVFGDRLSKHVATSSGTFNVRKESFIPFAREILKLTGGDETLVDKYGDFSRHVKVLATGGTSDFIEGSSWAPLIREGAAFGGLLLALRDMDDLVFRLPSEEGDFQVSLAKKALGFVDRILVNHGGTIRVELMNPVIDTIPMADLDEKKREAIKADLPKILHRMLRGRSLGQLDIVPFEQALSFFERGMRGQMHVEKIFQTIPSTVTVREFEAAAMSYEEREGKTESIRAEIQEVISVSKLYLGLHPEGSSIMRFDSSLTNLRSKTHLVRMQWFRKAMQFILASYATGPAGVGQVQDLDALTTDFYNVLKEWKLAHPAMTTQEMAVKRFREANLFMPVSNGDKYMDLNEGTYYIAFLFSSAQLSSKIFDTIVHDWRKCPIVGVDEIGEPAMEAKCFRENYFKNTEFFWSHFPNLVESYRRMTPRSRAALEIAMEKAARRRGYSEDLIGSFDINSFAALPHYAEDVMDRFDRNNDQVLDKKEILNYAYPIFRTTLQSIAGRNQDWILEAALTYMLKYGRLPKNTVQLMAWVSWRPFWRIRADRGSLYQVLAMLSEPIEINTPR